MSRQSCALSEGLIRHGLQTLTLENEWMAVVVLPDMGADIYQLIYKPRALDVLWKAPWGWQGPGKTVYSAGSSATIWLDHYPGGWQELFPNGGDACIYRGVELPFHGEVACLPWDYEIRHAGGARVEVAFRVTTTRTPFTLERVMTLGSDAPVLTFSERLTNDGSEEMEFMWGHHPAFGAPFLSAHCRLDVPAGWYESDDVYNVAHNPVEPGSRWPWPQVRDRNGGPLDLSSPQAEGARVTMLGYLGGLSAGWYALTNCELGFGVGLTWPHETLPYLWCYQEYNGATSSPFHGRSYVLCVEPVSSYPGQGLLKAIGNGTARRLAPGQSIDLELKAVFYESSHGVQGIAPDGQVRLRE